MGDTLTIGQSVDKTGKCKVSENTQSRKATGRESILCNNCAHVECDINEYKEKIKTIPGNGSGRFLTSLQVTKNNSKQSSNPEQRDVASEVYKLTSNLCTTDST